MKVISLECEKCGSKLRFDKSTNRLICDYCGAEMLLIDEGNMGIENVFDAMEKSMFVMQKVDLLQNNQKKFNISNKILRYLAIGLLVLVLIIFLINIYDYIFAVIKSMI